MMAVWMALAWAGLEPQDLKHPTESGQWVLDPDDLVPAEEQAVLEELLGQVHDQTGAEMAVVVSQEVQGNPKLFATTLFEQWELGTHGEDNGFLTVVSVSDRRIEMETGYGLEGTLSDGWLGTMQGEQMVPAFKQKRYGVALISGHIAIAEKLDVRLEGIALPPAGIPIRTPPTREVRPTVGAQFDAMTQQLVGLFGVCAAFMLMIGLGIAGLDASWTVVFAGAFLSLFGGLLWLPLGTVLVAAFGTVVAFVASILVVQSSKVRLRGSVRVGLCMAYILAVWAAILINPFAGFLVASLATFLVWLLSLSVHTLDWSGWTSSSDFMSSRSTRSRSTGTRKRSYRSSSSSRRSSFSSRKSRSSSRKSSSSRKRSRPKKRGGGGRSGGGGAGSSW